MSALSRQYIAIDLKSFYASVECVERGLDPLDTCLTVADPTRTDKTICLAVSPALKAFGTGGRPRMFELMRAVYRANAGRGHCGKSTSLRVLQADPSLAIDYIVAPPRMAMYIDYSRRIYQTYLRYAAPEDIHVYSIDEVFIDATPYLHIYGGSAHLMAMTMIRDVLRSTGITATAGIGSNLYLAKIAMDIVAKKMAPDADGVRIAELDEASYRRLLWTHLPLTDFWRVGSGTTLRLARLGIRTMGDIARLSLHREGLLFNLLGINAELLIDHAWGYEPVSMEQIKNYRPTTRSMSSGQVLASPYPCAQAHTVIMEMTEGLCLDLLDHGLLTDQIVLNVGYDSSSLTDPRIRTLYRGPVKQDYYGRPVPRHAHGTINLPRPSCSRREISEAVNSLWERIVNPLLFIRRLNVTAGRVHLASHATHTPRQLSLFSDRDPAQTQNSETNLARERENARLQAILAIKKKFGKNAILSGLGFAPGSTQHERNRQIGGHKA